MKYYVPGLRVTEDLEAQRFIEDKFGGLPWGLDPSSWPNCSECQKSQSFLAQMQHHPDRVDLGKPGRILFIFQCNHDPGMCSTWEGGSGANACFVVEPEDIIKGFSKYPEDSPILENEVRVVEWVERNDSIPSASEASFFNDDLFYSLSDEIVEKVTTGTKIGSVPEWIQSPSEAPGNDWQFLAQLDSTHSFIKAPINLAPWIQADGEGWEDRTHYAEGPNFGGGGIAYIFLKKTASLPEAWFFWQCG